MSDLTSGQEAEPVAAFEAGEKHTTRPPDITPAEWIAATAADITRVAEAATLGTAYHWVQDGDLVRRPDGKLWGDMRGTPVAEHVAAFDPRMALALAGFLNVIAREYARWPLTDQQQFRTADPAVFTICDAWWAGRIFPDPTR